MTRPVYVVAGRRYMSMFRKSPTSSPKKCLLVLSPAWSRSERWIGKSFQSYCALLHILNKSAFSYLRTLTNVALPSPAAGKCSQCPQHQICSSRFTAVGSCWDRQTDGRSDGQTYGHSTVSQTLLCILREQCHVDSIKSLSIKRQLWWGWNSKVQCPLLLRTSCGFTSHLPSVGEQQELVFSCRPVLAWAIVSQWWGWRMWVQFAALWELAQLQLWMTKMSTHCWKWRFCTSQGNVVTFLMCGDMEANFINNGVYLQFCIHKSWKLTNFLTFLKK